MILSPLIDDSLVRATLVVTDDQLAEQEIKTVLNILPNLQTVALFFVHEGTLLVDREMIVLREVSVDLGPQIFCAYSHRRWHGPEPVEGMVSGGLLDLGRVMRQSVAFFSLPRLILPKYHRSAPIGVKKVAILLDEKGERTTEGLRIGCGLAGCDHAVTLFFSANGLSAVEGSSWISAQARPYWEALKAMGGRCVQAGTLRDEVICDGWIAL